MKILFINSLADASRGSGAERVLTEQMHALRALGHECLLLATNPRTGLHRNATPDGTSWLAGPGNLYWPHDGQQHSAAARMVWHAVDSYNPMMGHAVRKVALRERPAIACIHNLSGWSVAAWAALDKLGIPVVQVLHDYYLLCPRTTMFREGRNCTSPCGSCRLLRLPHRALSRRVSAVVGVSHHVLQTHVSMGYFEGVARRMVLHNARRAPEARAMHGDSPRSGQALRFGYIGRLDPAKGVDALLEEFAAAALPGAQLWLAGRGREGYEATLRQRAENIEGVRFLGYVEADAFYQQVDVVIVPSLWNEPLGGVVFEAMSHGLPVIAARRGGIPEMIRHEHNGLLIEPTMRGDLAQAMRRVADDQQLRLRLRRHAMECAEPYADVARWGAQYAALFEDVIGEPAPAPTFRDAAGP